MSKSINLKRVFTWAVMGVLTLMAVSAFIYRDDILFKSLDPKVPYQLYTPPRAPDYALREAWAVLPAKPERPAASDPPADVFFIHPTTYDGGRQWNARAGARRGERFLQEVALPNYAGPFIRVGRVFAPRYRQASLYAHSTQREDAREARAFAYTDVRDAFRYWLDHYDSGRPLVIAGVEQGGFLAERLIREEVAADPALRGRLVAAYLIDTVVPREHFPPTAPITVCRAPGQSGCVVAWAEEADRDVDEAAVRLRRALVWGDSGRLQPLKGRPAVCVNPMLGAETTADALPRRHMGATNATGLEWGARPAFVARQISASCRDGLLRTSGARSSSLKRSGSWADRKKVKPFNLFYLDIEADAQARTKALIGSKPKPGR
jgi:hypothetical protein